MEMCEEFHKETNYKTTIQQECLGMHVSMCVYVCECVLAWCVILLLQLLITLSLQLMMNVCVCVIH